MSSKVGIVSLGCPKNQVDAEMLLFTLKSKGFELVNDPADADAVIVNTCGFIESAKQESINEIIELGKLKQEGKIKAIIVTGCLAERYKNEITRQLYEVDAALGIGASCFRIIQNIKKKSRNFPTNSFYVLRAEEYSQLLPTPLISKLRRAATTVVHTAQFL